MTDLTLYNSLTSQREVFTPFEPGKVRMYHCGPTVYKRQHLGNLRRFLFADFLRRTLEFFGYEVLEITNITDVGHLTQDDIDAGEDKLERAAKATKLTPQDIADREVDQFQQDIEALNIQPSHTYPRATQHIKEMQELIATLIAKQHAYVTATGVYFSVASFPAYGKLSGNTPEKIAAGSRVPVRSEKKHPADFALWIFSTTSLQKWDSPWGTGYPGWHIECSAMSLKYLGSPIDIHTGGEDNRFPHHENEIAQSEAAYGKPFVRFWLHNRHLQLKGQKLAKREGEQLTLDSLIEAGINPLAFRLFIFSTHYGTPVDFSWEEMQAAQNHFATLKQLVRRLHDLSPTSPDATPDPAILKRFKEALAADLHTPAAWAAYLEYIHEINTYLDGQELDPQRIATFQATLRALDHVVGVVERLEHELTEEQIPSSVSDLVGQREQARQSQQFKVADELRQRLESLGYIVEDTSAGPRVRRKE